MQYYLVYMEWYGMFSLLIPVYGALGSAIGTGLSYVMTIVYLKLFLRLSL